jgi:hypothetical protein
LPHRNIIGFGQAKLATSGKSSRFASPGWIIVNADWPVVWLFFGTISPLPVAIQQTENYLLVPRIMDRAVGVHPIVTLLAILVLSIGLMVLLRPGTAVPKPAGTKPAVDKASV